MNTRNKICPFCHEIISIKKHLIKCNPNVNENDSYLLMIELSYKCKISEIIDDYICGLSLPDIKSKYGLPYKTTTNILKIKNVQVRTIKESSNNNRLEKYKKTCNNKYGVDNVSKLVVIKNKKIKTFLENYGVDNIFKTNEFISNLNLIMINKYGKKRLSNGKKIRESKLNFSKEKWNEINEKTKNTYTLKYGEDHHTKTPQVRKNRSEIIINWWNGLSSEQKMEFSEHRKMWWSNRTDEQRIIFSNQRKAYWHNLSDLDLETFIKKNLEYISKTELIVKNFLDDNLIKYTQQVFVNRRNYDFLINNTKILIEVQGDYWHANPIKYKTGDLIKYPNKNVVTADSVWDNDFKKKLNAEKYGYKIIYLWEQEINLAVKHNNINKLILDKLYENI